MPKIKEKKEVEIKKPIEEFPIKIEDLPNPIVENLDDLREFLAIKKLNPLEKIMATELLLHNYSFIPQYKVNFPKGWVANNREYFIADFFLPDFDIIIETDGKIHLSEENIIKDRNKDNILVSLGYRVFRFDWDDVMKQIDEWDIFVLIEKLVNFINEKSIM